MIPRGDAAISRTLASLHAESWRAAYRGLYSDAFLDREVHAERMAFWTLRVPELRSLDAELYLATVQRPICGIRLRRIGATMHTWRIHRQSSRAPCIAGRGVGRMLVDCAADWSACAG